MPGRKDKDIIRETAENRLYTYGDYLKWDNGKRYEIIDGQVIEISAAPYRQHQKVSAELLRQFANYLLDKKCEVYAAPFDVRLPEGGEADEKILTVVQPDLVVICDRSKLDERGCRGAPDLVIEIISPSTAGRYRKDKRDLYERHGVKEYWLVDYQERVVEVYLLDDNNVYSKPAVYLEKDVVPVSILDGLQIELEFVFRE